MEEYPNFSDEEFKDERHRRTRYIDIWEREREDIDYVKIQYEQIDITGSKKSQICSLRFYGEKYNEELVHQGKFDSTFEINFDYKEQIIEFMEELTKKLKNLTFK